MPQSALKSGGNARTALNLKRELSGASEITRVTAYRALSIVTILFSADAGSGSNLGAKGLVSTILLGFSNACVLPARKCQVKMVKKEVSEKKIASSFIVLSS